MCGVSVYAQPHHWEIVCCPQCYGNIQDSQVKEEGAVNQVWKERKVTWLTVIDGPNGSLQV